MNYFDFGEAIRLLKDGKTVCRKGWNGKGMWLVLTSVRVSTSMVIDPCIVMKTVRDTIQPGWQATQSDMLAEDWHLMESSL